MRKLENKRQDEMPDFIGIARATWSKYETGASIPPLETLIVIADKFGITLDELIISDYENVHLIKKEGEEKNGENVLQNVHHQVHQMDEEEQFSYAAEAAPLNYKSPLKDIIDAIIVLQSQMAAKPINQSLQPLKRTKKRLN